MLVLTRRVGEKIMIQVGNELVEVKLLQTNGASAKIGVNANTNVSIHREEIYLRMRNDVLNRGH